MSARLRTPPSFSRTSRTLDVRYLSTAAPPPSSPPSPPPAASRPPRTIFSGVQPSGTLHLGNYLGAISNWVTLQNSSPPEDSIYYSIVGLHAITLPKDPKTLRNERRDMMASLLACGIDPERSTLFHQDMVPEHAELAWILNCITPMGKLNRMTTWKGKLADQKAGREEEVSDSELHLGLFAYPVLQAADILLYKATHVPVGEDQTQHLELSREIADAFNKRFGKKTFPRPQVLITPTPRILSLTSPPAKMSKSSPLLSSRILLTDSPSTISTKIARAKTDSLLPYPTYSPTDRAGVSNLLDIMAACTGESAETIVEGMGRRGVGLKEMKEEVSGVVSGKLEGVRREMERFGVGVDREKKGEEKGKWEEVDGYLKEVGEKGAEKARERAREVLREVKEKVGLGAI